MTLPGHPCPCMFERVEEPKGNSQSLFMRLLECNRWEKPPIHAKCIPGERNPFLVPTCAPGGRARIDPYRTILRSSASCSRRYPSS